MRIDEPVAERCECTSAVGDGAFFLKWDLGKSFSVNFEDRIVPEPASAPGCLYDPAAESPRKNKNAGLIRKSDSSSEPGVAIRNTIHQPEDPCVPDRFKHVCSVRPRKPVERINGKFRIVNDKRHMQVIIRVPCFLPCDLFYVIGAEFRYIECHVPDFNRFVKKRCDLSCLVGIAGDYGQVPAHRYLPLSSISCSRASTSSALAKVAEYPRANAALNTPASFGWVLLSVWNRTWISTPLCSISEVTCARPKSISTHLPSLSRRIMLLVVRSPCMMPAECNRPTIRPASSQCSSVRAWVRSGPVTFSIMMESWVISLRTGVGTPPLRAMWISRASARVRS